MTADGVVKVIDATMEQALRAVSVTRGVDPRGLALVAFGGAGPLHASALAEALDMTTVIVPARAGVFSAAGILAAPQHRELVRTWPRPANHEGVGAALAQLEVEVAALVGAGARRSSAVDARYAGQSHELTVASVADFPDEHERRNGYALPDTPIEVVTLPHPGATRERHLARDAAAGRAFASHGTSDGG